jgi:UDP-glucose 4-epimerase
MAHRIAIVGGTGYIGNSLYRHFSSLGLEVWVVGRRDKTPSSDPSYRSLAIGLAPAVQGATTVIHCASATTPAIGYEHPELDAENVLFTIELAKACVKVEVKNLIFTSSGGTVYGEKTEASSENDALAPISSYGIGKVASESHLRLIAASSKLNIRVLRVGNPYGRVDSYASEIGGVVPYFIRQIIKKEPVTLFGNTVRDYIYIDDLVAAYTLCLEDFNGFDVFNIASGQGTSLKELLGIIAPVLKRPSCFELVDIRPFDVSFNVLNIDQAKRILRWEPKFTLNEGIFTYVEMAKDLPISQ